VPAVQPAASYEETALAGALTEAQLDAIVEKFVHTSDVGLIARSLDIPRRLVLEALEDGTLAERALRAKRTASTVRFLGLAIDRLLSALALPPGRNSTSETVATARLLRDILGLRADILATRHPKPPKEKAPSEPKPEPPPEEKPEPKKRGRPAAPKPPPEPKLGALERALLEIGD
jgi:hypothetical protein